MQVMSSNKVKPYSENSLISGKKPRHDRGIFLVI